MKVGDAVGQGLGARLHREQQRAASQVADQRSGRTEQDDETEALPDRTVDLPPVPRADPLADQRDHPGGHRQRGRLEQKGDLPVETDGGGRLAAEAAEPSGSRPRPGSAPGRCRSGSARRSAQMRPYEPRSVESGMGSGMYLDTLTLREHNTSIRVTANDRPSPLARAAARRAAARLDEANRHPGRAGGLSDRRRPPDGEHRSAAVPAAESVSVGHVRRVGLRCRRPWRGGRDRDWRRLGPPGDPDSRRRTAGGSRDGGAATRSRSTQRASRAGSSAGASRTTRRRSPPRCTRCVRYASSVRGCGAESSSSSR